MLALNGGRPELLTLREIIAAFIAFREEVITRRTSYLLGKARDGRTSCSGSRSRSPISTR